MVDKFQEKEIDVDLIELSSISDLSRYDTVIMAAPINGMQWVEPAKYFLEHYKEDLKEKRLVAVYVSYIIRSGSKFWRNRIRQGFDKLVKPIEPIIIKDFGGVIEGGFPTVARWLFGIPKGTPLDLSDGQEVEEFARELVDTLVE